MSKAGEEENREEAAQSWGFRLEDSKDKNPYGSFGLWHIIATLRTTMEIK